MSRGEHIRRGAGHGRGTAQIGAGSDAASTDERRQRVRLVSLVRCFVLAQTAHGDGGLLFRLRQREERALYLARRGA